MTNLRSLIPPNEKKKIRLSDCKAWVNAVIGSIEDQELISDDDETRLMYLRAVRGKIEKLERPDFPSFNISFYYGGEEVRVATNKMICELPRRSISQVAYLDKGFVRVEITRYD